MIGFIVCLYILIGIIIAELTVCDQKVMEEEFSMVTTSITILFLTVAWPIAIVVFAVHRHKKLK